MVDLSIVMLVYQRVNLHFPMVFPFSYGFSYVFMVPFYTRVFHYQQACSNSCCLEQLWFCWLVNPTVSYISYPILCLSLNHQGSRHIPMLVNILLIYG